MNQSPGEKTTLMSNVKMCSKKVNFSDILQRSLTGVWLIVDKIQEDDFYSWSKSALTENCLLETAKMYHLPTHISHTVHICRLDIINIFGGVQSRWVTFCHWMFYFENCQDTLCRSCVCLPARLDTSACSSRKNRPDGETIAEKRKPATERHSAA